MVYNEFFLWMISGGRWHLFSRVRAPQRHSRGNKKKPTNPAPPLWPDFPRPPSPSGTLLPQQNSSYAVSF